MTNLEIFTECLTQTFNRTDFELREISPLNPELQPLHLFIFKNYPDQSLTTFVTYGLSEKPHPQWHVGRPELLLSVESEKETWGMAMAGIVIQFRGEKSFSYGSTYVMDGPITEESGMTGFVIFKPIFLESEACLFQLLDKTVYLAQAYPIYPQEADMIKEQGFERFWNHKNFQDPYDIKRKELPKNT